MQAIIIGNGSIGKRYHRILQKMNISVRVVDIDEKDKVDDILNSTKYDFGLVCTPNCFHLEHVFSLCKAGIPFLCEKPLYVTRGKHLLKNILELVETKKLINMISCNLRFQRNIKNVTPELLNKAIAAEARFGYDLSKWHCDGKHLQLYSANKSMDGGVTFDCIHEFDYLYSWFGSIRNMSLVQKKISNVTVDTEDLLLGVVNFENGVQAKIKLDYLEPVYTRYCILYFKDGTRQKIQLEMSNDTHYQEQIEYFIDNIKNNIKCMNNITEASYLIEKIDKGIVERI